ncbi:MAG: hypothetical protein HOK63_00175 [Thaumarchaeota archaeon]|jgi:heme/copper-type cytochrome/quinol oxidase subunit 2|nr:hypothetical protein [Nitrososphaerota archaeon]MBT5842139.1 hypothetical protein [Nitrososphaerota archaeon]MBT6468059.1 hypothetical protein [Nitrososphaerota archaeon]
MNKKIIIIPIIIVITIFVINFTSEPSAQKTNDIFHITLASPDLYSNGKYTKTFEINKGDYSFRFVPNGSSPKILTISVVGENFNFDEIFELKNTLHQTGISEYFTWEYDGTHSFNIPESGEVEISINPNGNVMGSVSVDILQN